MTPTLDNLTVDRHVQYPDGRVELSVRIAGPLPDGAADALDGHGVTTDGDDAVVLYAWPPGMAPADPRAAVRESLTTSLLAWALAAEGALQLSDPGELL